MLVIHPMVSIAVPRSAEKTEPARSFLTKGTNSSALYEPGRGDLSHRSSLSESIQILLANGSQVGDDDSQDPTYLQHPVALAQEASRRSRWQMFEEVRGVDIKQRRIRVRETLRCIMHADAPRPGDRRHRLRNETGRREQPPNMRVF
jgi:hypothetical protein